MTFYRRHFAILAALVGAGLLGCGTRQPVAEVQLPPPVMPNVRACPGALVGTNVQITDAIGDSSSPVIAWDGEGFLVSWWDLRGRYPEIRVIRLDHDGVQRTPSIKIPDTRMARNQTAAFDGKEVHLVWQDDHLVKSARFGTGEPVSLISPSGKMPAAGAWGGAVWVERGALLFRSDGMLPPVGHPGHDDPPEPQVVAPGGIEDPQLAWNGQLYAIVWSASVQGGREIRLQRMSHRGRRLGPPVRVSATAGVSRKPMVAWTGESFAVAWTNAAPAEQNPRDRYRVFLALVPPKGHQPTMTRQLQFQGSADQVALASTGKELGLAWVGSKEPRGTAVYFQRLSLTGELLGDTMEVTDGVPLTCGRPSLSWAGDGYAVAWHDDRVMSGSEIFFAFVHCGTEDSAAKTAPEPAAPPPEPKPQPAAEPKPAPKNQLKLKDVFDND